MLCLGFRVLWLGTDRQKQSETVGNPVLLTIAVSGHFFRVVKTSGEAAYTPGRPYKNTNFPKGGQDEGMRAGVLAHQKQEGVFWIRLPQRPR